MKVSDFDYNLPRELIAQEPIKPRDHSRLLVLDKKSGEIEHKKFFNLVEYLKKGDVLVLNNSKVMPARLIGKKEKSGGKVEVFLLKSMNSKKNASSAAQLPPPREGLNKWQCMVGGRRAKAGLVARFEKGLKAEILKNNEDGTWELRFNLSEDEMMSVVEEIGEVPLPPYIKKEPRNKNYEERDDKNLYQTTFASDEKKGSVAAPTAGLHFTPGLIKKLEDKGVQIEYITLHVGLGTFAPVKVDDIKKHKMHSEYVEIERAVAERIIKAKKEKKRIVAVGTTTTRSLEAMLGDDLSRCPVSTAVETGSLQLPLCSWVDIFIYPGYEFKIVDAMITNFHLPKSTLVMLVSALAGKENIDKAYESAVKNKYRFYSYGDAMFIQ